MFFGTCGFESHPRYKLIMLKLDLHNNNYEDAKILVLRFIENNIDNLPLEIVTGNSNRMIGIVKKIVKEKKLHCYYSSHVNLGSLIITELF